MKNFKIFFLAMLLSAAANAQVHKKLAPVHNSWEHYDTDALIASLRKNHMLDSLLNDGSKFYQQIGLDEGSCSHQAFLLGYLAKKLYELHQITINHNGVVTWPLNHLLVVVDFTKTGDQKRMVIVDIAARKLLFHTYVAHGKGKYYDNPLNANPRFFSDVIGSNMSSLGFMVTGGPKKWVANPCHFCRFNTAGPAHDEQLYIHGLETGYNDKAADRIFLVHTTGSKDLSDPATEQRLKIDNKDYHIDESAGRCYFADGKSSTIYASKAYIDSTGYIGRSDGCFVVPEEEHRAIIETINKGTLIFSYSDVISRTKTFTYNYFEGSPVIGYIKAIAGITK